MLYIFVDEDKFAVWTKINFPKIKSLTVNCEFLVFTFELISKCWLHFCVGPCMYKNGSHKSYLSLRKTCKLKRKR